MGLLTDRRNARRDAGIFHQQSMDRLRLARERQEAQDRQDTLIKREASDRQAGASSLIKTDPALSSAFAGEGRKDPAALNLLQALTSTDPAARALGGGAAENIRGRTIFNDSIALREAQIEDIAAQRDERIAAFDLQKASQYSVISDRIAGRISSNPVVGQFGQGLTEVARMKASFAQRNVLGIEGSFVNIAKIYDPEGVVREGEREIYTGAVPFLQNMQLRIDRLKGGFNEDVARELLELGEDVVGSRASAALDVIDRGIGTADRQGIDARDVLHTLPFAPSEIEPLMQSVEARAQRRRVEEAIRTGQPLPGTIDFEELQNPGRAGEILRGP